MFLEFKPPENRPFLLHLYRLSGIVLTHKLIIVGLHIERLLKKIVTSLQKWCIRHKYICVTRILEKCNVFYKIYSYCKENTNTKSIQASLPVNRWSRLEIKYKLRIIALNLI